MNFANTEDEKEEFLKYADNLPSDTSDVNGSTDVYKSYLQVCVHVHVLYRWETGLLLISLYLNILCLVFLL